MAKNKKEKFIRYEYEPELNMKIKFRCEDNVYCIHFIEDGGVAIEKTSYSAPSNYGNKLSIKPIATNHIVVY